MSDNVTTYLDLRQQLLDELTELEVTIPDMIARRDRLREVFGHDVVAINGELGLSNSTAPLDVESNEDRLLRIIKENPGIGRGGISAVFEGQSLVGDKQELNRLIKNAAARGQIRNRGTKRDSRWFFV